MIFFVTRKKRIAEIKAVQAKSKFGDIREISAVDYVQEVNKAGDDIWVVLHLFQQGYVALILYMITQGRKLGRTGFLRC